MKFVLGTAQLGMEYGVANRTGKPSRRQAVELVRRAVAGGVSEFDTARSYGDAEQILGEALAPMPASLRVITKLDRLNSLAAHATPHCVSAAVDKSVARSREALQCERLPTLLLHGWDQHRAREGGVWERLLALQAQGEIGELGASVYEPAEALDALQVPAIRHLQIPFNALDRRWRAPELRRAFAARPEVRVHARSIFLQGLLARPGAEWPVLNSRQRAAYIEALEELGRRFSRASIADLCMAYVRAQSWINGVIVGLESEEQLEQNLDWFRTEPLTSEQCSELERKLPPAPEELLNPTRWETVAAKNG